VDRDIGIGEIDGLDDEDIASAILRFKIRLASSAG
jgi:hypothetical protein